MVPFDRMPALTDPRLKPGADLLAEGRAQACDWRLGVSRFQRESGYPSEAAYKRAAMVERRVMQHAHIGFRNVERTIGAMAELHGRALEQGFRIDRFGITLDWSMGYPTGLRADAARGTGIVLTAPEDFARIIEASPAATHFGDFMLGLPGALENTRSAIAAGATSIGNLGQYFTFRLPHWDDDVATTEATVTALGLIAAQEAEILVHSNLDDGFAGLFIDMACALGMVIIEKHIVEGLIGARLGHCYGHHFSDPLSRSAFHEALVAVTDTPGTMIFGNTVAYRAEPAVNYASLGSYLLADILSVTRSPSGHAINPVPVTENQRIPDTDEILDAQGFAARLARHARHWPVMIDMTPINREAGRMVEGGRRFAATALKGLEELGVDILDPAALMLAIRRIGPKRMEALWGPGEVRNGRRQPILHAEWARELNEMAEDWLTSRGADPLGGARPKVCIGTTDVHEHGKYLVERAIEGLGAETVDAGVSVDPGVLVARGVEAGANAIAISTYNGVALGYAQAVRSELDRRGLDLPVLMGGKLNQIPTDSNSGLPVDVSKEIAAIGVTPCNSLDDMLAALRAMTAIR